LEVTADGEGIVSHAGLALLRGLADKTGLTAGLSRALASTRVLVHDRGGVTADLACAIADGARAISDFPVMGDQRDLFGPVASVPTAWRTLAEIAVGDTRTAKKITAAVNTARRHAWDPYAPTASGGTRSSPRRTSARRSAPGPDATPADIPYRSQWECPADA
jgi:hypothetical protein